MIRSFKVIISLHFLFLSLGFFAIEHYSFGNDTVQYWNRNRQQIETEVIPGRCFLSWLYNTHLGQFFDHEIFSKHGFAALIGTLESSHLSAKKIPQFIKKMNISMDDFEEGPFVTFNDFFIRKFKLDKRPFITHPNQMPAFAEARYLGYDQLDTGKTILVKNKNLNISELIGIAENSQNTWNKTFLGGPILIARLSPADYHRFHFPDDGKILAHYSIHGKLESVNPIALAKGTNILSENERQITILETKNFGKLAYIEVGAMLVGKIQQTFHKIEFHRGEEKGYFLFGASTVIVLGEAGRWKPDAELLEQTSQNHETLIQLGTPIASGTH